MQVTLSLPLRARAGLAGMLVVSALGVSPTLSAPASADVVGGARGAVTAECGAAQQALAQARKQRQVAKANLVNARQALRRAKASGKPVKIRKAQQAVDRIGKRYRTLGRTVTYRGKRVSYACAAPTSTPRAKAAGNVLGLLGIANGIDLGPISAAQLSALLERVLPGVTDELSPTQLSALLAGFNAIGSSDVAPTDLLAILAGGFSPTEIASLLAGAADPAVLEELAGTLLGQLSGLAGGSALPGSFDPADLLATFAGIFGELDPAQLGELLALVATATGADRSAFDLEQLTGLLDSLVPGISESFDAGELTALLTAFSGHELDAAALTNLLGGQFSLTQLQSVLGGAAGDQLIGAVIAQVMAQLATAGGGGLELPSGLGADALADLVGTVTDLIDALTGGGVLPVICGIIPIPGLCD